MHASHVAATRKPKKPGGGSSPRPTRAGGDSSKKQRKPAAGAGSQGMSGWTPLGDDCWVRGGEVGGDIRNYETAIVNGSLFARAVSSSGLNIGDHLLRRLDSILVHPDTMRLCGLGIGQPVAVQTVEVQRPLVVCKSWPFKKMELDVVALSPRLLRCFEEEGRGGRRGEGRGEKVVRVEVWRVPSPFQLPLASELHLSPQSPVDDCVLNESFKNYTRSLCDGLYLCEGNSVTVPFCHQDVQFTVERVVPVGGQNLEPDMGMRLSLSAPRNLTALLEESLRLDMSRLKLDHSPSRSPVVTRASPSRFNVVTSTPGMEVDKVHSGTESVCRQLALAEIDSGAREVSATSLEREMQGLGLEGEESSEREEVMMEVVVCKITAKTDVVFVGSGGENKNKGQVVTMEDIGGLSRQKQLLKELVLYPLSSPSITGVQFPRGVLLYGPSGVGKSLLVSAISSEASAYVVSLFPSDLQPPSDSSAKLQRLFKDAREKAPSLVVLEDVHCLCGSAEGKSVASSLVSCLDDLCATPPSKHIVVVATTNQIEEIDSSLRRPGRFEREIEVTTPTAMERRQILKVQMRGVAHSLTVEELMGVADSAHGFTGSDLTTVCMQAQHKALRRQLEEKGEGEGEEGEGEGGRCVVVRCEDVRSGLREVRPSAMREVTVEVPKVLWSDIGGQEQVKKRLREAVEWPLKHPEAFSRLGVSPPKGVLLYGPPGCSKTMIARAVATESGLNFISVKGPELFSKWVGESEKAVRQVFQRARAAAPAIIFFDEIDALAVARNSGSSSVADRVLAQLLTEMDGVEKLSDVLIVAATNRPDLIDKALLRPGRIDRMIYVPLPSDGTRREIFQISFRRMPVASDISLDQLVSLTQGFSGAEVVALCQEAALSAMHEDISVEKVSHCHFQQALKAITPQTQPSTIASYERYANVLK